VRGIQADLEHTCDVMALWSDQFAELVKALEKIDAVGDSRAALRGERQGQQGRAPVLTAEMDRTEKPSAEESLNRRG
jgi:hypothetical protein